MIISEFKRQFPVFAKSLRKMNDTELKYHKDACIYQGKKFSNQKNIVIFLQNRMEAINEEISTRIISSQKEEVRKAKLNQLDKKNREIPKHVMYSIRNETEVCPYCFEPIINGNMDHIYPLTLGGLNISQNLVFCCDKCNNKKAGMTLNEFIYKYNLDWKKIKQRLKELNKRF